MPTTLTAHPAKLRALDPKRVVERRMARAARNAVVEWVLESGCTWCLTLNPNRSLPLHIEVAVLRDAFRAADELMLGPRFKTKDARRRLMAFIFAEHEATNLHFHLAVRPGPSADAVAETARMLALADAWACRVAPGTFELNPATDARGWARYITKESYAPEHQFWTSSMWWPDRQRKHELDSSWHDPFC
jgi:hypothetical protein